MSYNFFNQVIPPTGVELCLSARFTSEDDVNLIVAKTNVLEVYALHRHEDSKARPIDRQHRPAPLSPPPLQINKFFNFRPNSIALEFLI